MPKVKLSNEGWRTILDILDHVSDGEVPFIDSLIKDIEDQLQEQ